MNDFSNMPSLPPPPAYLETSSSSTGGGIIAQGSTADGATLMWIMSIHNALIPRYIKLEEEHLRIKKQLEKENKAIQSFRLLVFLCYCLFLFSSFVFVIAGIFVYIVFIDGSSMGKIDQIFSFYKFIGYGTFVPIVAAALLLWNLKKRIDDIESKLAK